MPWHTVWVTGDLIWGTAIVLKMFQGLTRRGLRDQLRNQRETKGCRHPDMSPTRKQLGDN